MRILITGGAGFVAGHLIRRLLQNRDADIYAGVLNDRERELLGDQQSVGLDVTDPMMVRQAVSRIRPDRIFHLAAQSSVALSFEQPELTYRVNVEGTANLLEAVKDYVPACRVLLTGSADQYGTVSPENTPIREDAPLDAGSPYGISKIRQEELGKKYAREYGLDVVMTRSFPHIGPGQSRRFVIADWCAQAAEMAKRKDPHPKLIVGNLEAVRDFTDVRDVVEAYAALLEKGSPGQIYNVCSGTGWKLAQVPDRIAKAAGLAHLDVRQDPSRMRPSDIPVLVGDNSRLKAATGWKPAVSFQESLADIVRAQTAAGGGPGH